MDARLSIHADKERSAVNRVQDAYGENYDLLMMFNSKRDVSDLLGEGTETKSIRERLRQKQHDKFKISPRKIKYKGQEDRFLIATNISTCPEFFEDGRVS